MTCPNCGSEKIQAVSEVESKTKGFDCCSGLIGYLLLGPWGWLCGLCGMGEQTVSSKILYVCTNCGRKFSSKDDLDPPMRRVNDDNDSDVRRLN